MVWKYNDGGREEAGYKGKTGDCFARALAIATHLSYQEAYDFINEFSKIERTGKRKRGKSNARTGVYKASARWIMEELGWKWTPTMFIGSGCKVHLKADELPKGKIICNVSKHFVAVVDGVIQDTFDCSRNETRCVYGYWGKE